jgi:S-adenosylmethionine:tRNA ribosyltransferase-isomerase
VRRDLLHYDLPPELIAARPPAERDGARMLVLDEGALRGSQVRDLDRHVAPGTLVVVNDTRVIPARLFGHKEGSGGRVEILLVRRLGEDRLADGTPAERWSALGRASKPLREGARIAVEGAASLAVEITSGRGDGGAPRLGGAASGPTPRAPDGSLEVRLYSPAGEPIPAALDRDGHMPLPPYMHRPDDEGDRERYQTVFARVPGAVAAPTAGLHLTPALMERLRARGAEIATVTLHVGLGTFQPVTAEDLDDHPMHSEVFSIPEATARAVAEARRRGAPVLAIGTTVVRALESAADPEQRGLVRAIDGETRLLIQPGYRFRVVDQLLTNFHLPESTLLALVSAFAGRERVLDAYRAAVAERYRFFSYGDAMLILSPSSRMEPS